MSTSSKTFVVAGKEIVEDDDYITLVDGVGPIPRDIYKYVKSDPTGDLPRYSVHIVIQHLLIFVTFIVLSGTGLPLYFSDLSWAQYLITLFGGIDLAREIHKVAAFTMMFASAYHIVTIVGGTLGKIFTGKFDYRRTIIPRLKDLSDLFQDIKYFMGFAPYRPKMEKFMYKQKAHYLAILWGSFVLMAAGSALLFPDVVARLFPDTVTKILPTGIVDEVAFPSFFQSLARLMHADEAVMALIVIAFWHWLNVHLVPGRFPLQWAFLNGKITREHQLEEHFLEYLRNLQEIPEEREYMRKLLKEKGFEISQKVTVEDIPRIL
jgi:cytochrome b subunit of formate dehydrogenase